MVKASDVKALNAKIERLNTARTKAETQKELLGDSLERELKSYQEKYGKVLKGKTFVETVSLINKELESVSKSVTEEYELKSKIVEAVENQDYEQAYKLLGVEPSENTHEESKKDVVAESEQEQEVQSDDTEDLEELLTKLESESDETPVETEDEAKEDDPEKPIKLKVSEIPTPQPINSLKLNIDELSLEEEEVGLPDLGQQDFGFGNALQGTQFKV